jgi:hypothetical protein
MCDYYTKEEAIEQMNKVYSIASQKVEGSSCVVQIVDRSVVVLSPKEGKVLRVFCCDGASQINKALREVERFTFLLLKGSIDWENRIDSE